MAYPVLAPNSTWFAPTNSSVTRSIITEIEIMDSYTPDSSVTVVDSWDASAAKDGSITCYVIGTKLIIAGNASGKIAANEDSSDVFAYFVNMSAFLGTSILDVSNVTNMQSLFWACKVLTTIDVSNWDVSKVSDLQCVFGYCPKLTSIEGLDNWNISRATNLYGMFAYSPTLTSLNLSNWDVSNVVNTESMFENCTALTSVGDLSNWNVSKVTNMKRMFLECKQLTTVGNLSNWDISNVTNMGALFYNCLTLTSVGDLSNWNTSKAIVIDAMFCGCEALTSVGDLSNWNVSKVTDLQNMFNGCMSLTSIGNISNWDTSNVTTMKCMFEKCSKLTGIGDLANWDVSNVTDMSFMFWGASSIGEIDVSKWDVSKVTTLDHFAAHARLRRKGIENWKTASLVNANAAFHNCAEEELDLSGWDVSKVEFFDQMFENSPNLKHIKGLEKWNTSAGLGFGAMFERCYVLEELDLSSFDTSKAKNDVVDSANGGKSETLKNMFLSCNNLKKVKVGPKFSINGNGSNTTAANKAILPTPSSDYIEGADGMWYAFNGEPHAPNAIKDKTAETYFASYALCADQDIIVKNGSMIDAAKAIREKNGATDHYTPAQFGAAIRALN